ncbi:STAS domain-containing protein [Bailinhaonella thermotolerans]|uniref:STAS domain-containing protein n=1 Tax=Bailinhaonella thermotolerans TaxID=1070861 RepID=UPI001F5BB9A0|nr:STAS domain-containing protein [Bailinhaonella thermotolerans]
MAGEIDIFTAPDLRRCLMKLLDRDGSAPREIVVDLAGVTFIDNHGLQALLDADLRARPLSARLLLAAPSDRVSWLLRLTALDGHFASAASG